MRLDTQYVRCKETSVGATKVYETEFYHTYINHQGYQCIVDQKNTCWQLNESDYDIFECTPEGDLRIYQLREMVF